MIKPREMVPPEERLSRPRTVGIGAQHVVAIFGATFLVPILMGLSPSATLFFTGADTIPFFLITSGRLSNYLGSSLALIAPIAAAAGYSSKPRIVVDSRKITLAQGGVIVTDLTLTVIDLVMHFTETCWIGELVPPVVTGAVVSLTNFNLAPNT